MSHRQLIDDKLDQLGDQLRRVNEELALLSMLAIARIVRETLPNAAAVGLSWSDQGLFLVPDGYRTADGRRIRESAAFSEDALDSVIGPYCANLGEENDGTWRAFASSSGADGPDCELKIDDVLAAGDPGTGASLTVAASSGPGGQDDSGPPPAAVWVLQYDDGHGEELSVHATYEHGLSALAKIVRGRWDNITGHPEVPATCDDLTEDRAVELYFARRTGIECYWLLQEEVEGISPATGPGDLSGDPPAGIEPRGG